MTPDTSTGLETATAHRSCARLLNTLKSVADISACRGREAIKDTNKWNPVIRAQHEVPCLGATPDRNIHEIL